MQARQAALRSIGIAPAAMLLLAVSFTSFAQGQAQSPAQTTTQDLAQGPIRVCIGDICAGSGKYNLGCDFAYAHPKDTDDQAAIYVCQFLNNFSQTPKSIRVGAAPGGKCGVIYLDVKCQ